MNKQTLALKPCPFCGGEDLKEMFDDGLSWIKCLSCGTTGPATTRYSGDEDEPYPYWNARPLEDKAKQEQKEKDAEIVRHFAKLAGASFNSYIAFQVSKDLEAIAKAISDQQGR